MTWGARRPRVLLPGRRVRAGRTSGSRAVLAHELAHIRRGDWLVHMLAEVVCAIYWFHPLFWIARTSAGRESEHAADDEVLGAGSKEATTPRICWRSFARPRRSSAARRPVGGDGAHVTSRAASRRARWTRLPIDDARPAGTWR